MEKTFHWVGRIFGVAGFVALLGAWSAVASGTTWGLSQQHLYSDAIVLMLASISAIACAMLYLQEGRRNQ